MPPRQQAYTTDLSDREWQIFAPLLPAEKPGGRHGKYPMPKVINAIQYVSTASPLGA